MEKTFVTDYGNVSVRTAVFDLDGTTLLDGIEVKSLDNSFYTIEIYGYHDIEEMTVDDVERIIEQEQ